MLLPLHKGFLLILIHQNILRAVKGHLYKARRGKVMTGQPVLVTRYNISDTRCAMACHNHKDCWSFNYMRDTAVCELNAVNQEPVIIEHQASDLYSKNLVFKNS